MLTSYELINKYRLHGDDTGSTMVQLIKLEEQIQGLANHLAKNRKDVPVKRSLLKKVAKKKRFLKYLQKTEPTVYEKLSKEFNS